MSAPWLETTWYGGSNNAVSNPPGRVLALSPATAAFSHDARVRRGLDGTAQAQWLDGETWRDFKGGPIPAALLQQAETEAAARAGGTR